MSEANTETIERFYRAFDAGDGETMASCYAPNVQFSDPVFTDLNGREAGAMWRMLTSAPGELKVELLEHDSDESSGSAHWKAHYTFTDTGRPVVNDIQASFRFEKGLITEHRDGFSFYAWARQALGTPGLLLGWTPILRAAVRRKAGGRLEEFLAADRPGA
jgi:ketosteroid isomerase-like protein